MAGRRSTAWALVRGALALVVLASGSHPGAASRSFPDTSTLIGVITDQLPDTMTPAQVRFAATHYVGTQKLGLNLSRSIRAINPGYLVLHYHLAMWQSAPNVDFIIDGTSWGNDFRTVTMHESWFWHNAAKQRVTSNQDGKFLMNVTDPGFQEYWSRSLAEQVQAGSYDGVFLDSASPALLQWEAQAPPDPRLSGTGVRTNTFPELGGKSWIAAWQDWIARLDRDLAAKGIALIPNVGALTTTWDNTDYALTAGVFLEDFGDPKYTTIDWQAEVDQLLALVQRNKIVILQNYLSSPNDLAKRRYLLATYLLVKGARTYVVYFEGSTLRWYPEWNLDLGPALKTASRTSDLSWNGIYRRDFSKGVALVNPTTTPVHVNLESPMQRVEMQGGGTVAADGTVTGKITTTMVTTLDIGAKQAEILLR
jgi:hypothetical protein